MAYVRIRINPNAFDAGAPLEQHAAHKREHRVVLGAASGNGRWIMPGGPVAPSPHYTTTRACVDVDLNGWAMTDSEFNRLPLDEVRAWIADMVRRSILIVDKAGVAQTADAVLSGI